MKIGIYPGSFNPFHIGHYNIYQKACKLFDKVYVCYAANPLKGDLPDIIVPSRVKDFIQCEGILFNAYKALAVKNKCTFTDIVCIRGIRNSKDYEYQSEQDYWLKDIDPTFSSVYIECDSEYRHISSTAIRTLENLAQPYKHLLP